MNSDRSSANKPSPEMLQRLSALRNALLHLHKIMMDSERITYEATFGTISSKNEFLRLLIEDPWFTWLRPISQMVVMMDEALDAEEPVNDADINGLIGQVRMLVAPSDKEASISPQYLEALQRDPDVVLAHSELLKLLR